MVSVAQPPPRALSISTIEDATRREFMFGALGAALIMACGDDDATTEGPSSRTITTSYGTYDVPLDPQRLLLMGNRIDLETALALELRPIAIGQEYAFHGGPAEFLPAWIPFDSPDDVHVFSAGSGSIEQMLLLEPDLIFCRTAHLDSDAYRGYANLSRVAPIIPVGALPWREELQQVATWLNREEELARALSGFQSLVDEIKAKHADHIATARVSYGSINPQGEIALRSLDDRSPVSQALDALGGHVVPFFGSTDNGIFVIGPEALNEVEEADAVLFWSLTEESMDTFLRNPLRERMPAHQNHRLTLITNNISVGSIYTIMESLKVWDQVYSTLG